MRRHILIAAALLALLSPAKAADSTVSALTSASAFGGTELLYVVQSAADRKGTPAQMATYVHGLITGDCTITASVITCTKINGNTFPASGTSGGVPYFSGANAISSSGVLTANLPVIGGGAGAAPSVGTRSGTTTGFATYTGTVTGGTNCAQWDTNGNLTAAAASCGSGGGASGANPTATAGPTAVNGVAATFMRSDGAPAVQQGSSSQKGIVQVDGTTITESSGVISTAPQSATPTDQTGTNYAFQSTDRAKVVYLSNAANQVPTIAQATGSFGSGWFTSACNTGAGTQTITPTTSTIGGAATFVLPAASAARPACVTIISDGTNYRVYPDFPMDASYFSAGTLAADRGGAGTINGALKANGSGVVSQAACADLSDDGALCSATPGTGVATAIAANLSAAGGLTTTIASGTSALGTSAIASGACATVVTTAATNTATTDVILVGFNGDPTAVTGYAPSANGMLTIINYPTTNNVNHKVCNNTGASVTPGAITLNWRVVR